MLPVTTRLPVTMKLPDGNGMYEAVAATADVNANDAVVAFDDEIELEA